MSNKQELIKRLEIRKQQLINPQKTSYPIHNGHHLRDITTVLAYLKNENDAIVELLINKLPDKI
ncbi:MAG: hypothetical protein WC365_09275 [Candidatus Babeliales bacterium]|jgi:hypothetical protein